MKGISYEQLKEEMLNSPEAIQAYKDADRELAMIELFYQMRENGQVFDILPALKDGEG